LPKHFPGVTHAIVRTVKGQSDLDSSGAIAYVSLCFINDDDALLPITIKKMTGPTSGITAHIPKTRILYGGKPYIMEVLKGAAADEVKMAALVAFDQMKQKVGVKWDKKYRVNSTGVEEIGGPNAVSGTRVG
jgi:hypothetical protein